MKQYAFHGTAASCAENIIENGYRPDFNNYKHIYTHYCYAFKYDPAFENIIQDNPEKNKLLYQIITSSFSQGRTACHCRNVQLNPITLILEVDECEEDEGASHYPKCLNSIKIEANKVKPVGVIKLRKNLENMRLLSLYLHMKHPTAKECIISDDEKEMLDSIESWTIKKNHIKREAAIELFVNDFELKLPTTIVV